MVAEKPRLVLAPNAIQNDIPEITALSHLAYHAFNRISQAVLRERNLGIPELDADDWITVAIHTTDYLQVISLGVDLDQADIGRNSAAPLQIRKPFDHYRHLLIKGKTFGHTVLG